jgi:succinoglycan biosynthesis protein ExoA
VNTVPFVSIIMPVRNEADFIAHSLGAVLKQDYPHDRMEVLIADGMSTDATRTIIDQLSQTSPITIKVIDNPKQIVPTGMNLAMQHANGEIIVRVDGHTMIETEYVRACVKLLQSKSAANVGGKMNAVAQNTFGNAVAIATSSPFGVGGARFHYSNHEEWVDTVYMGAWWRSIFDKIGLFDEELVRNQDDEFNYRLRASGERILLSPTIRSIYYGRNSLRKFTKQYYQYGVFKVRVLQKHPRQMQPRQFVPPLFAAGVVVGAVIAPFSTWLRRMYLVALALYAVLNVLASLRLSRKNGMRYALLLPVIFATLHLSYGLGFWRGTVKFWNRWGT